MATIEPDGTVISELAAVEPDGTVINEMIASQIPTLGTHRTCLDKTVLLTIGRMNSLTSGHMGLINTLIMEATRLELTRINIILSATVDNEKNPLECDQKRKLIYDALTARNHDYDHIWVEVVCMDDESPESMGTNPIIKSINEILSHYIFPEKIIIIVGQDRANDFFWISKYIKSHSDEDIPIEFQSISRPEGAISATFIRNLVIKKKFTDFKNEMKSLRFSPKQIKELYNDLFDYLVASKGGSKKTGKTYRRRKTCKKTRKKTCRKTCRKTSKKRIKKRKTINKKS